MMSDLHQGILELFAEAQSWQHDEPTQHVPGYSVTFGTSDEPTGRKPGPKPKTTRIVMLQGVPVPPPRKTRGLSTYERKLAKQGRYLT
jgi:hypothetical protein